MVTITADAAVSDGGFRPPDIQADVALATPVRGANGFYTTPRSLSTTMIRIITINTVITVPSVPPLMQ
jgi:hypothetical protein